VVSDQRLRVTAQSVCATLTIWDLLRYARVSTAGAERQRREQIRLARLHERPGGLAHQGDVLVVHPDDQALPASA